MKKRIFPILIFLVFFSQFSISQNLISGNVIRENKKPFVGVKVTIEGVPNVEAVTDQLGNFDIEVPLKATNLVFSYNGMKTQKIGIGKKSFISVTMIEGMDEKPKPEVKKEEKPKEVKESKPKEVNESKPKEVNESKPKEVKESKPKENTKEKEKPKTTKGTKEIESATDSTAVKEPTSKKPAITSKDQGNTKKDKKTK
jgi:hypothetical protein